MARRKRQKASIGSADLVGPSAGGPREHALQRWGPVVLVAVAAIGVYANSLNNGFLYDDGQIILNDVRTRDPAHWREIFTRGYWYRRSDDPIYRPIPLLTYLANHVITDPLPEDYRPAGYRVFNLALHAGVSLLVYAIGLQLSGRRGVATAAGVLFAVHPIHGEVVVIVIGRADLLCAFLYLLGIWQLLREPLACPSRFSLRFCGVLVLFGLALLTKENAVTFVGAAVLVDLWRRWRVGGGGQAQAWSSFLLDRLVRRYLPILAVVALSLLVRYQVLGLLTRPTGTLGGIDNPLDEAGLVGRVVTPLVLLGKYLNLLVWPHPLCYDYSYNAIPVATGLADQRVWFGLGWAVLMVIVAVVSWRRSRRLAWCVAFFVVAYSVVSNSVVLIGTLFAERVLYLPSAAWCWVVALALAALWDRCGGMGGHGRIARVAGLVVVVGGLVGYSAKTIVRNARVFLNDETLYADGVRVNPGSARCQSFAARRYVYRGDHKTAIKYFRAALDIDDTVWFDHTLIGQEYALDGQVELGLQHLHRGYELSTGQFRFEPAFLLGQVYVRTKRPAEALKWLEEAIRIKPSHPVCAANLAYALARVDPPSRDVPRAMRSIEASLADAPNDATVLEMAYAVFVTARRSQRAAEVVQHALRVIPRTHPTHRIWLERSKRFAPRVGGPPPDSLYVVDHHRVKPGRCLFGIAGFAVSCRRRPCGSSGRRFVLRLGCSRCRVPSKLRSIPRGTRSPAGRSRPACRVAVTR